MGDFVGTLIGDGDVGLVEVVSSDDPTVGAFVGTVVGRFVGTFVIQDIGLVVVVASGDTPVGALVATFAGDCAIGISIGEDAGYSTASDGVAFVSISSAKVFFQQSGSLDFMQSSTSDFNLLAYVFQSTTLGANVCAAG